MAKIITAAEAAALIYSNSSVAISGFGGYGSPEEILIALEDRYERTAEPSGLTMIKGVSVGDYVSRGTARLFEHDRLIDTLICSHIGLEPATIAKVSQNKVKAYMVPLGSICHLLRAIAGKKPGYITQTGIGTFAEPRLEGSKANEATAASGREIVKLIDFFGEEYLFYPSFPIDVCILRGSMADADGNVSCCSEPILSNIFEMAAAVRSSGGIVIVQVPLIVERGTIKPKEVVLHSSLVDYIVVASPENSEQCLGEPYRPEVTGQVKTCMASPSSLPLNERKICARRALLSLKSGDIINLGIGMPDAVSAVAAEEGVSDKFILSIEAGSFGGVPLTRMGFGAAANPEALLSIADTFDLYDGGLLDCAVLGAAEIDMHGNVNVSKFGGRVVGPGGFINISQYAKSVCFIGSFTAGKLSISTEDGKLKILRDGAGIKFKNKVEQISFSADYAVKAKQKVMYITERAVFELTDNGIVLTEIAPGVDIDRDILPKMEFVPIISKDIKLMDARIFSPELMNID